jgi:hypothetical protein
MSRAPSWLGSSEVAAEGIAWSDGLRSDYVRSITPPPPAPLSS